MALKADDRKALNQIKKILAGLEGESYVKQAMDGMIEDAESNIENDFWNSWRMRAEYLERDFNRAEEELAKVSERAKEAERRQKMAEGLLQTMTEEADKWFNQYNAEKARADAAQQKADNSAAELQRKVEAQELEIMKLKAKLYDMMVGA